MDAKGDIPDQTSIPVLETNDEALNKAEQIVQKNFSFQSAESIDQQAVQEGSQEKASEVYETQARTTIKESSITDLPSIASGEKKSEEGSNELERDAMKSVEQFDTPYSTKEREIHHKDETEANEGWNVESSTISDEQATSKDSHSDLAEISSVPEVHERENIEEHEPKFKAIAEESNSVEAEAYFTKEVDRPVKECLVSTGLSEDGLNDTSNNPEEISNIGENKDGENPTENKHGEPEGQDQTSDMSSGTEDQRDIASAKESLNDISEQSLESSSTLLLKEHGKVEKPADVSSLLLEASEEKVADVKTNISPPVVTEVTSLEDNKSNEEIVRVLDASPEAETVEPVQNTGSHQDSEVEPLHGADEAEKREPEVKDQTSGTSSTTEVQKDISSKKSLDDISEQNLESSSTFLLTEHSTVDKPTDVSSLLSEASDESVSEVNTGVIEHRAEKTNAAPTVVTEATSLEEHEPNEESVRALDASPEAEPLEMIETTDTHQDSEVNSTELGETSQVVAQLPVLEDDKANNGELLQEKSELNDIEDEETRIPDAKLESNETQGPEEIQEADASLIAGESDRGLDPQAFSELKDHGIEAASNDETAAPAEITETSLKEVQQSNELMKEVDTSSATEHLEETKTDHTSQQEAEVEDMKHEVHHIPVDEHENAKKTSTTVEKSDATIAENAKATTPDEVSESENQSISEIHETNTNLAAGETGSSIPAAVYAGQTETTKERAIEEESSREEHPGISAEEGFLDNAERVLPIIQSDQITSFNDGTTETEISIAADHNQVPGASTSTKALEEEAGESTLKPVDNSSSGLDASEENANEVYFQVKEHCDEKTTVAPTVVARTISLEEDKLNEEPTTTSNEEPVSVFHASSEVAPTTTEPYEDSEVDSMDREGTSGIVAQLPIHEHEKANSGNRKETASTEEEVRDNVEAAKTEPESDLRVVHRAGENEAENQTDILQKTDTVEDEASISKINEDPEQKDGLAFSEPEESLVEERKDATPTDTSEGKYEEGVFITGEDNNVVDDQHQIKIHHEQSEESFMPKTEAVNFNIEKSSNAAPDLETTASISELTGQVHEVSAVHDEEDKKDDAVYESSIGTENTIQEHNATDQAGSVEIVSSETETDTDQVAKDHGLNSEGESREINTEYGMKEYIEQKERAVDKQFQVDSTGDDSEKYYTTEDHPTSNSISLSTVEESDYHGQADQNRPNKSTEEEAHESNTGEQICTKSDETKTIDEEVIDLYFTPSTSLEPTTSDSSAIESQIHQPEKDLYQVPEAPPFTKPLEEEPENAAENPIEVSSLMLDTSGEKVKEVNVEVEEYFEGKTNIAPTVETAATSLEGDKLNEESMRPLDPSPEAVTPETIKTTDGQQNSEVSTENLAGSMHVPTKFTKEEVEEANSGRFSPEKSGTNYVDDETTTPEAKLESNKDQAVEEVQVTATSLTAEDSDRSEIKELTREVPVAFSELKDYGATADSDGETAAPVVITEAQNLSEVQLDTSSSTEHLNTAQIADIRQQDGEVGEASDATAAESTIAENPDEVSESKDQFDTGIHETNINLTAGTNEIDIQTETPETIFVGETGSSQIEIPSKQTTEEGNCTEDHHTIPVEEGSINKENRDQTAIESHEVTASIDATKEIEISKDADLNQPPAEATLEKAFEKETEKATEELVLVSSSYLDADLAGEDNFVAEDQRQNEAQHEKQSEGSFTQKPDTADGNRKNSVDVASDIEGSGYNTASETITSIKEPEPVKVPRTVSRGTSEDAAVSDDIEKDTTPEDENLSLKDVNEKTVTVETEPEPVEVPRTVSRGTSEDTTVSDDIEKNTTPEEEKFSLKDVNEKTIRVDTELFSNNSNDTNLVGEKQDEASMSNLAGQVHDVFVVHNEVDGNDSETSGASKSTENIIMGDNTSEGGLVATDVEYGIKQGTEQKEIVADKETGLETRGDDIEKIIIEEELPISNKSSLGTVEESDCQGQEDQNRSSGEENICEGNGEQLLPEEDRALYSTNVVAGEEQETESSQEDTTVTKITEKEILETNDETSDIVEPVDEQEVLQSQNEQTQVNMAIQAREVCEAAQARTTIEEKQDNSQDEAELNVEANAEHSTNPHVEDTINECSDVAEDSSTLETYKKEPARKNIEEGSEIASSNPAENASIDESKDMKIPTGEEHGLEAAEETGPEGKNQTQDISSQTEEQNETSSPVTSPNVISQENPESSYIVSLEEHHLVMDEVHEEEKEDPEAQKTTYGKISVTSDREISKSADLNQVLEATKVSEEETGKAIEKPDDIPSSSLDISGKGDETTGAAPGVIEAISLEEGNNEKAVEAFDVNSDNISMDTLETTDRNHDAEVDSINLEDASSIVAQHPTHEGEEPDSGITNIEIFDRKDAEVNETAIPDAGSESKDEVSDGIPETVARTGLTVGHTGVNETGKQIEEVPDALPEPINHGIEEVHQRSLDVGHTGVNEKGKQIEEVPETLCEPIDRDVKEVNETSSSLDVVDTDIKGIEKPIREAPDALSQPIYHAVEESQETVANTNVSGTDVNDKETQNEEVSEALSGPRDHVSGAAVENETFAPTEVSDVKSMSGVGLIGEHEKDLDTSSSTEYLKTIETPDTSEHDAEVDRMKLKDNSSMAPNIQRHEPEKTGSEGIIVERSDGADVEADEVENPDAASELHVQDVTESHEQNTSPEDGEADTNKIERKIAEGFEALKVNDIATSQTPPGEQTEKEIQVSSSASLPNQDSETTAITENTVDSTTVHDNAEVTSLDDKETANMESQLSVTGYGSTNKTGVEKSNSDDVEVKDIATSGAMSECNSSIEAIPDAADGETSEAIPDAVVKDEKSSSDDVEIKETTTSDVIPEADSIGDEEINAEVHSVKLVESSGVESYLSTHKHEKTENESIIVEKPDPTDVETAETILEAVVKDEKSNSDDVEAKDNTSSDAIPEADNMGVEEIHAEVQSNELSESSGVVSHPPKHEDEETENEEIIIEKSDIADEETAETITDAVVKEEKSNTADLEFKGITTSDAIPEAKNIGVEDIHAEVRSMKLTESTDMESHLIMHEPEKTENESTITEKSDAADAESVETIPDVVVHDEKANPGAVEVEDTATPDAIPQADSIGVEEIHAEVQGVKLVESSDVVSHLSVHEHEKTENEEIMGEKYDVADIETDETIPDAVAKDEKSNVDDLEVKDIATRDTTAEADTAGVKEIDTNAVEKDEKSNADDLEVKDIAKDENSDVADIEAAETIPDAVAKDDKSNVDDLEVKDMATRDTIAEADTTVEEIDTEVQSMKLEESSSMVSHLPMHENEKTDNDSIIVKKYVAADVEAAETTPDAVVEDVREINETHTSPNHGETNIDGNKKQVGEVQETSRNIDVATSEILHQEEIDKAINISSSLFLPNQDSETTVIREVGVRVHDKGEVANLDPEETSLEDSQLPVSKGESENNTTMEKSNSDDVIEVGDVRTFDAVLERNTSGIEENHERGASQTAEGTGTDKDGKADVEESERTAGPKYQIVEVDDSQTSDQPLPVIKLLEELQASETMITEKRRDPTDVEVNQSSLKVTDVTLPRSPTTELEQELTSSASTENADSKEVDAREASSSEALYETEAREVEVHEIEASPTVGGIQKDGSEKETATYTTKEEDLVTVTKFEMITAETTDTDEGDLNEKCATVKPCLQDDVTRELQPSNLDVTARKAAAETELNGENAAQREPILVEHQTHIPATEYADSPTQCEELIIQDIDSKEDDVSDFQDQNSASENLLKETGEKSMEASVSEISSPYILDSGETDIKEPLKAAITEISELRDVNNHTSEISGGQATKQDASLEKFNEEKQVVINSELVSPEEVSVPKTTQEDELREENTIERSIAIMAKEIQHEELSRESEEHGTYKSITEPILAEDQTVKDPTQVSVGQSSDKTNLTGEVKGTENPGEEDVKLDLEDQRDDIVPEDKEIEAPTIKEQVESITEVNDSEKVQETSSEDLDLQYISERKITAEKQVAMNSDAHSPNEEDQQKVADPGFFVESGKAGSNISALDTEAPQEKAGQDIDLGTKTPITEVENSEVISRSNEDRRNDKIKMPTELGELQTASPPIFSEHAAEKAHQSEITQAADSNDSKDVPSMQDYTPATTFQEAEVKALKAGVAPVTESEVEVPYEKSKVAKENKEQEEKEKDTAIDSDGIQSSNKETPRAVETENDEKESQAHTAGQAQVEAEKTDEDEEGDEHNGTTSSFDSPVMVEASSRDIEIKTPPKKSHNILSGVGSKVKHSIAKVKKVITGKSPNSKTSSKEDKKQVSPSAKTQ